MRGKRHGINGNSTGMRGHFTESLERKSRKLIRRRRQKGADYSAKRNGTNCGQFILMLYSTGAESRKI